MFETYTLHILASSKTLGTVWSLQFLLESLHSSESPCPKNLGQKKQQHLWLLKTQNLPLVTRLNIKKPKGRNFQRQRPKRCRSANLMERCTRQEEHAKWSRRNIKRDVSCWFLSWCSVYTRNLQLCLQYQPVRFKNWRKFLEILNIETNQPFSSFARHRQPSNCCHTARYRLVMCHVLSYSPAGPPALDLTPSSRLFLRAPQLFIKLPFPPLDLRECKIEIRNWKAYTLCKGFWFHLSCILNWLVIKDLNTIFL